MIIKREDYQKELPSYNTYRPTISCDEEQNEH